MNLIGRFSSSSPPTRLHLSFSHSPASKYATCFSCDAHAMEESRRSREALYFQGICVDASVNDPRVRGDADTCVYRPSARGTRIRGASALFIQDRTCNRSIGHYACRKDILFGTTPRSTQLTSAPCVEKSVIGRRNMRRVFHAMRTRWKNREDRTKLYIFRAFSWMPR